MLFVVATQANDLTKGDSLLRLREAMRKEVLRLPTAMSDKQLISLSKGRSEVPSSEESRSRCSVLNTEDEIGARRKGEMRRTWEEVNQAQI